MRSIAEFANMRAALARPVTSLQDADLDPRNTIGISPLSYPSEAANRRYDKKCCVAPTLVGCGQPLPLSLGALAIRRPVMRLWP